MTTSEIVYIWADLKNPDDIYIEQADGSLATHSAVTAEDWKGLAPIVANIALRNGYSIWSNQKKIGKEIIGYISDGAYISILDCPNAVANVRKLYDELTDGQRAYLFNKILKEQTYNPKGTSITKLIDALVDCSCAQGDK